MPGQALSLPHQEITVRVGSFGKGGLGTPHA